VNTPLLGQSPGYQLLTLEVPLWENTLNNSVSGQGPTVIRGTDPMTAPGGYQASEASYGLPSLDTMKQVGVTVAQGIAGSIIGIILFALGVYLLVSEAGSAAVRSAIK